MIATQDDRQVWGPLPAAPRMREQDGFQNQSVMSKKKVLLVHYASPSGQLSDVMQNLSAPLAASGDVDMRQIVLRPRDPYPFPWPILRFFDTFPETIYLDAPELAPLGLDPGERFDLVILGYQVWFLSPSLP